MKCKNCGAEVLEDAECCTSCGVPVGIEISEPENTFFDRPEIDYSMLLERMDISAGHFFEVIGLLGRMRHQTGKK